MLYLILEIVIVVVEFLFGCDYCKHLFTPPLGIVWSQCEFFIFDTSSKTEWLNYHVILLQRQQLYMG